VPFPQEGVGCWYHSPLRAFVLELLEKFGRSDEAQFFLHGSPSKGVTAPKLHWALDRIKREPFFQHNFQVGFWGDRYTTGTPAASIIQRMLGSLII
jgi:hypothetical protein